jgi:hypothetical protein
MSNRILYKALLMSEAEAREKVLVVGGRREDAAYIMPDDY